MPILPIVFSVPTENSLSFFLVIIIVGVGSFQPPLPWFAYQRRSTHGSQLGFHISSLRWRRLTWTWSWSRGSCNLGSAVGDLTLGGEEGKRRGDMAPVGREQERGSESWFLPHSPLTEGLPSISHSLPWTRWPRGRREWREGYFPVF